jgi:N-acetylglucosaminyldiphosphoundecaprenol N-acetyl-beta-D-mannosaminyltransferase
MTLKGSGQRIGETSEKVELMGVLFDRLTMADLLEVVHERIAQRGALLIGVVNVAKLVKAQKDRELMDSLHEADVVVADGLPVVWLSSLCRCRLPERIAGIDLMYRFLEEGNQRGYAVYFLGATQEVVEKVVARTQEQYPGTRIAGCHHGYFKEEEESQIADEIRRSNADILLVALPTPKKESFLKRWRDHVNVPVCHGVGGSFDVVAGVTKRAPAWMQRCGLEWLYRVIQEPRRMWKRYLVTNGIFLWLSVIEIMAHRLGFKKSQRQPAGRTP